MRVFGGSNLQRAYYSACVRDFLYHNESYILGQFAKNNQFGFEDLQQNTWLQEIIILKQQLREFKDGHILFEYTIPRIGKRIDNVLIYRGFIFLLEFKVGEREYPKHAIDQVMDYALDLKDFHKESHNKILVPMLVATESKERVCNFNLSQNGIFDVLLCNKFNLRSNIKGVLRDFQADYFAAQDWIHSKYMPTPTIIEAAQALYRGHNVEEISRSDAGALNLNLTTKTINQIIDESKKHGRKSICFLTGVPGAGKTLAGLNIANERHKFEKDEHAVFLSGNQPLVEVLREALARDESKKDNVTKEQAKRKTYSFIQNIHHYRDAAIMNNEAPGEKIAIFDEAQRAWHAFKLTEYMNTKKKVHNFNMSEPEFLISIMDRHQDWAVIICLVGGGQEINKGEAGLLEWFNALRQKYSHWNVFVSNRIGDSEYVKELTIPQMTARLKTKIIPELHLSVSLRSFRSENVSDFVKALLDVDKNKAKELYKKLKDKYPILITRDINKAKTWVKACAGGTRRYGMTASSGAKRLRVYGIWVQSKIKAKHWFLNGKEDVRSSYYLEDTATEFDIQGLELDWTIVCWDANFRFENGNFNYYRFRGSRWENIKKETDRLYLKNAYRVLLTRARQGLIIFIPNGDSRDSTRPDQFYNETYQYLKSIGIDEI